eukprot:gene7073-5011_t
MAAKIVYPAVRRTAATYTLHGRTIPEPYDYLEDPEHEDTKKFVVEQGNLFQSYLQPHDDMRQKIFESISKTHNFARTGLPSLRGDYYYYTFNSGLQNQNVIMRTKKIGEAGEQFLDPNVLAADGTSALGTIGWSKSQQLMGYGVSDKGSDWMRLHIRDAATKEDLADRIDWCKFSVISWWKDEGFFYTRYPELADGKEKGAETDAALDPSIYFHKVRTPQSEDIKIISVPEHPKWNLGAVVSDCQEYVMLSLMDGCEPNQLVWIAKLPSTVEDLKKPLAWNKVVNEFVGEYDYIGNDGELFYFVSTKNAPRKNIVSIHIGNGEEAILVPETEAVLSFASLVRDTLLLVYMEDVKNVVYYRKLHDSTKTKLQLPIGTIAGMFARRHLDFVSFQLTSFTTPGETYTMDINDPSGSLKVVYANQVSGFNAEDYVTEQQFYAAKDGTKIPMFLVHRKGALTPQTPVLLYAYGGFNISIQPAFNPTRLTFLNELGGCLVVANIRGGGEYGTEWHNAGRRENKQNCFDDFIAALRYLHSNKIGSPATTAIQGGSNGGLLMGAVSNQAPSEMSAVVAQVGVMDLFKFHKFTIGHAWCSDYGDPDVEKDFLVVEKFSPLHNIKPGVKYPAIAVLTGDHDDRVVPLHSLKYLATLQHANPDPEKSGPFFGRIEISAGHGAGKPTEKILREAADIYTFIAINTGAQFKA